MRYDGRPRARREEAIGSIPDGWAAAIGTAASAERLAPIADFVARERDAGSVLPDGGRVFAALRATPLASVRARDPGSGPVSRPGRMRWASGSRSRVTCRPRSHDLSRGFGPNSSRMACGAFPDHGSLEVWTRNGVLLLNTILTVREATPVHTARTGRERLTDDDLLGR